ncbi:MAG: hypothetical protein IJI46_07805 [Erysipelotrichaceae bacterium]|nr:hypothetical protein [Erysipelotrichaceae bacterium]
MNRLGKRILIYIIGIIVLALGLTLNTKTGLGCSPIIAVAYALAEIFKVNLGDVTFMLYCLFVIIELLIQLKQKQDKKQLLMTILQLPFSIVFTRFMNLYANIIPDLSSKNMVLRLIFLFVAIVCTGVGAAMILNVRLVANPADGIVACLAQLLNKETGLVKNAFDISCIILTLLICLVFFHPLTGVGIGSVVAMLMTGRVISLFNKYFKEKIEETL